MLIGASYGCHVIDYLCKTDPDIVAKKHLISIIEFDPPEPKLLSRLEFSQQIKYICAALESISEKYYEETHLHKKNFLKKIAKMAGDMEAKGKESIQTWFSKVICMVTDDMENDIRQFNINQVSFKIIGGAVSTANSHSSLSCYTVLQIICF